MVNAVVLAMHYFSTWHASRVTQSEQWWMLLVLKQSVLKIRCSSGWLLVIKYILFYSKRRYEFKEKEVKKLNIQNAQFLIKNPGFYNCLPKDGIEPWHKNSMCAIASGFTYWAIQNLVFRSYDRNRFPKVWNMYGYFRK